MEYHEFKLINKGLSEKNLTVFYIGLDEGVLKSLLADNLKRHHWLGLNYFFAKEYGWKPNYKPNSPKAKEARMLGSIFIAIYELCKETYLNQKLVNYTIPWNDGIQWFGRCCRDFSVSILIDDYNRPKTANKKDITKEWREKLRSLKSLEIPSQKGICLSDYNPFLKYGNELMGLITLIEASYSLAGIKPSFGELYWRKFLNAIDNYIEYLEDSVDVHHYSIPCEKNTLMVDIQPIKEILVETRLSERGRRRKRSKIKLDW